MCAPDTPEPNDILPLATQPLQKKRKRGGSETEAPRRPSPRPEYEACNSTETGENYSAASSPRDATSTAGNRGSGSWLDSPGDGDEDDPRRPIDTPAAEPPSPGMTPPRGSPTNSDDTMSDDPPQSVATSLPSTEGQDEPPNIGYLIGPEVERQPSSFGLGPIGTNPGDGEGVGTDSIDMLLAAAQSENSRLQRTATDDMLAECRDTVDPSNLGRPMHQLSTTEDVRITPFDSVKMGWVNPSTRPAGGNLEGYGTGTHHIDMSLAAESSLLYSGTREEDLQYEGSFDAFIDLCGGVRCQEL